MTLREINLLRSSRYAEYKNKQLDLTTGDNMTKKDNTFYYIILAVFIIYLIRR